MRLNYEEELKSFQDKWNLPNYDLKNIADSVKLLRFADGFLSGASTSDDPATNYVKWLSRTLSTYFANNVTPNDDGIYTSSFKAQEFYDSFKRLAQAKYDSETPENETPHNVQEDADAKEKSIKFVMSNCKKKYNNTLPEIWQEKLKKGDITVDELNSITGKSTVILNDGKLSYDKLQNHLSNVVAAHEAMQQLRDSRSGFLGWLWKLFHKEQNDAEKRCLNHLVGNLAHLSTRGYDVASMKNTLNGKTVFGSTIKDKEKAKEVAKPKTNNTKKAKETAKIGPVAVTMSKSMAASEFMHDLVFEMKDSIPENNSKDTDLQFRFVISKGLVEKMNTFNLAFDAGISKGNSPESEMEKAVANIFKLTVKVSQAYTAPFEKDLKLETIKAIAKVAIDNCTAVACYPDELGGLVDGFIEKSAQEYTSIIESGKDYIKEMKLYKDDLFEEERVQAFDNGDLFADNNGNKSPQISQQSKINPPAIDNNH